VQGTLPRPSPALTVQGSLRLGVELPSFSIHASRRDQLQRMLGDDGEVLPRVSRGSSEFPAAGWYARVKTGKLEYLGDHFEIAIQKIAELIRSLAA
jgi:hypothetical protein